MAAFFNHKNTSKRIKLNSEINITPMVDVMLVLLIVFMVAAPLLTVGVNVNLPETKAGELNSNSKPIIISFTKEGLLYIGEDQVDSKNLISQVNKLAKNNFSTKIFIRADKEAYYGDVIKYMADLSSVGYRSIALITDQEQ